jgi:hypothetical protein
VIPGTTFALLVMICTPAPVAHAVAYQYQPDAASHSAAAREARASAQEFEWVDTAGAAATCRLYDPPWLTGFAAEAECEATKADLAAPIIGGGVRFECVPVDPEVGEPR